MIVIIIVCNFLIDFPENNNWIWIHIKYYNRHASDAIYNRKKKNKRIHIQWKLQVEGKKIIIISS